MIFKMYAQLLTIVGVVLLKGKYMHLPALRHGGISKMSLKLGLKLQF